MQEGRQRQEVEILRDIFKTYFDCTIQLLSKCKGNTPKDKYSLYLLPLILPCLMQASRHSHCRAWLNASLGKIFAFAHLCFHFRLPFPLAFGCIKQAKAKIGCINHYLLYANLRKPGKLSLSKERWQSQAKGSVFLKLLALTLASQWPEVAPL